MTRPEERGSINGWMQTGMLLGRALLGGGALIMAPYIGWGAVVMLLIMVTVFSAVLVMAIPMQEKTAAEQSADEPLQTSRRHGTWDGVKAALTQRNTWVGLIFALTGGACFKALEVMYGPFLIDRGFNEAEASEFVESLKDGQCVWFIFGPTGCIVPNAQSGVVRYVVTRNLGRKLPAVVEHMPCIRRSDR